MKSGSLTRLAKVGVVAFLLGVSAVSVGCEPTIRGGGQILVDRPEVFTRERLLNRRLQEQAWLQRKLDERIPDGFQGMRDVRQFEGLYLAGKASFDPLGADKAEIDKETAVLEARKKNLIARRELRNAEEQAISNLNQPGASAPGTDSPGGSSSGDNPASELDPKYLAESKLTAPKVPDQNITTTRAVLTAGERLRDEAAYRNQVQALLREQELDDTHDLQGLTLYTLKFDVSILPAPKSNAMAYVEFTFTPPERPTSSENSSTDSSKQTQAFSLGSAEHKRLWEAWTAHVIKQVEGEMWEFQRRAQLAFADPQGTPLTLSERQEINKVLVDTAERPEAEFRELVQPGLLILNEPREALTRRPEDYNKKIARAACHIVQKRYEKLLQVYAKERFGDYREIGTTTATPTGFRFFLPTFVVNEDPLAVKKFKDATNIETVDDTSVEGVPKPASYVYAVEPKELAQNISDVSAKENLLSLVGALSATMPNSGFGDVSAYAEFVRRSQERLQAVLRKPLVVGWPRGKDSFGWIFGPRFAIDEDGRTTFEHAAVQHAVQATVAVPAWANKVVLYPKRGWVMADGTFVQQAGRNGEEAAITVSLPQDLGAITRFLYQLEHPSAASGPVIADKDQIEPIAAGDADVFVRGTDLWRNPEVYIGSQRAQAVRILPDMRGLVASFSGLRLPPGSQTAAEVSLRVVTSEGMDQTTVRMLPDPRGVRVVEPFLRLKAPALVGPGAQIVWSVDRQRLPSGYSALRLRVLPFQGTDADEVVLDGSRSNEVGDVVWTPTDILERSKLWLQARKIRLRPEVQLVPRGDWFPASGDDAVGIRFPTEGDRSASMSDREISAETIGDASESKLPKITIANTNLVLDSNGEADRAWRGNFVHLKLTRIGGGGQSLKPLRLQDLKTESALVPADRNLLAVIVKEALSTVEEDVKEIEFVWELVDASGNSLGIPTASNQTVKFKKK